MDGGGGVDGGTVLVVGGSRVQIVIDRQGPDPNSPPQFPNLPTENTPKTLNVPSPYTGSRGTVHRLDTGRSPEITVRESSVSTPTKSMIRTPETNLRLQTVNTSRNTSCSLRITQAYGRLPEGQVLSVAPTHTPRNRPQGTGAVPTPIKRTIIPRGPVLVSLLTISPWLPLEGPSHSPYR